MSADDAATKPLFALVTGASAGIGVAFARELAARGHALILTARRLDRLEELAAELRATAGVRVECIACDLADANAAQFLFDETRRRGLEVDFLINNAGYGVTGSLVSHEWPTHADFLNVMITAPTALCHRFVPAMRARGFGRIINVASFAGLMPAPAGHTLYAAAKAYLVKFSESLALENRRHGIHVCALCPGFTMSEMHDVNGARETVSSMPAWVWLDAKVVARQGVDAVERGDIVYINGWLYRTIKALFKLVPDRLALWLVARSSHTFRVND
ncbi:MAG: SDR family NAD(P)-dependent oxidoreductase [Rhodanobacteraceae bacterium]